MQQEVSAGAVIYRNFDGVRKYLLLHYRKTRPYWDFAKGKVEKGEQHVDTARREAKEETGLSPLSFKKDFLHTIHFYYTRDKNLIHKSVHFFLAESPAGEVTLSDEHIGYVWLPYGGSLKRLSFENSKELLRKAEACLS